MSDPFLFTSESVSEGHPDKVADCISDTLLDAILTHEPEARVAIETMVTNNTVVLAGETRTSHQPDYDALVRAAIRGIGYTGKVFGRDFDAETVTITNLISEQSAEIAQGVDSAAGKAEGAGDQGLMFGYAINETPELMPAPIHYAHRLVEELAKRRHGGDDRLGPDAKSQVTLVYRNGLPVAADTVVVSHQHAPDVPMEDLRGLVNAVIDQVMPASWITPETRVFVNPTGSFVYGGPGADTGLTGRKIIVDTYGGMSRHGGGAFSGKDPTKVDRSAAYAARYLAKNIVAAGLAGCCEIQLCYAIGVAEPLAVYLDTFGTARDVSENELAAAVAKSMDLTPRGIRTHLGLNAPIYSPASAYGHFGRQPGRQGEFSWEKTDLTETLVANL